MGSAAQQTPAPPGGRVTGGLLWMYLATGAEMLLQAGVLAVLARLVTPRDFGLVTAALVVLSFGTLLARAGLETALVQHPHLTDRHIRAAFAASVGLALLAAAALAGLAPWAARLYGLPDIAPLVRMLAIVLLIQGVALGEHLLARELRFRPLALIQTVSFALGYGLVAVVLALRGFGPWALIGGQIGQALVATIGFWVVRPHPVLPRGLRRPLADLLGVGAGETTARLVATIGMHGDAFVVGRTLGAASLGIYDRAYRLMELPTTLFSQSVRKVLFPAMSAHQHDREFLGRAYLTGIGALAAATLPVSAVLALVAPEVVAVLLGPAWTGLVGVLQILVFGMVFRAGPSVSDSLALARGAVLRQIGRVSAFAVMVLLGAGIGQRFGLTGVAAGVLAAMGGNYLLMGAISRSLTGVAWAALGRAHLPAILLAAGAVAASAPVVLAARAAALPAAVVIVGAILGAAGGLLVLVRASAHHGPLLGLAPLVDEVLGLLPDGLRARLTPLLGRR